jgi:hypothetical protein
VAFAFLCAPFLCAQDPAEIVRRSVERDLANYARMRNYTFIERSEERSYDKNGKLKSTESETYDLVILGGRPYGRKIAKNDKPLPEREQRKEQEKLDREADKRSRESPADKAKQEKARTEQRKFLMELPLAYDFRLEGTEQVSGKPAWVIEARPKPGYRARESRAKLLSKVRGRIWIDQAEYQWVKAEAEAVDALSFGFGLFRIAPGGSLQFAQVRVNDEVWLPSMVHASATARLGYLKNLRAEIDVTYKDYRKFQTDSRIVSVEEQ